ncbi:hypothetical protein, partial [Escherichia sp. MOD1-EC5189]
NVKRLAGRVMLTGAFLYLPLVFMPEADSLKHPQQFYLTPSTSPIRKSLHESNNKTINYQHSHNSQHTRQSQHDNLLYWTYTNTDKYETASSMIQYNYWVFI